MSYYYNNKYTLYIYENNEWVALTGVVRPFSYTEAEDETLDSGVIQLSGSTRSTMIKPFTIGKIAFSTQRKWRPAEGQIPDTEHFMAGAELPFVISSTKRVKRTFSGTVLYDWQLDVVELTKLLERIVCDNMTFTNYLSHDYTSNAYAITPEFTSSETPAVEKFTYTSLPTLATPALLNSTITISKPSGIFTPSGVTQAYVGISVKGPNDTSATSYGDVDKSLTLDTNGVYEIKYYLAYHYAGSSTTWLNYYTYNISVCSNIDQKTEWTIPNVVNRILAAGKTRRSGIDTQRITLDSTFATEYASVKSPEFFITRSTFYDALSTVGGAIHAIPRLKLGTDNALVLTFDKLGQDSVYTMPSNAQLNYEETGYNVEEYTGTIDSIVENIVDTTNPLKGSMVEPSNGGYTTVRTTRGSVQINGNSMIIQTSLPIYRVNKLEVSAEISGTLYQGDITPYVFENAEYQALSNYNDAQFPYAKAYALCYTQGSKDITGLDFTAKALTSIASAFQKQAIYNILQQALGVKLDDSAYSDCFINLAFRVTYTPIPTARVVQKKPYTGWDFDNTLIYNQDGNTVEANSYGEKLKGAITRLGNRYVVRTYTFVPSDTSVFFGANRPQLGQKVLIDSEYMYITLINATYDEVAVKMTIWFTPDFNRLSQYVGINSNYRLYDVSEKQSIERLINYSEICYVGDLVSDSNARYFMRNPQYIPIFTLWQYNTNYESYPSHPTCAFVTFDNSPTDGYVTRPLKTLAIGNSIAMSFSLEDNYGAGYQAINKTNDSDNKANRIQRLYPYGDVYGEFTNMRVRVYENPFSLSTWATTDQQDGGAGNTYPFIDNSKTLPTVVADSGLYPFIIQKDSREKINFTYQLHYVANRKDVVIGSAMTQNSSLVGTAFDRTKGAKCYGITKPLNILQDKVDLTDAVELTWNIVNASGNKVQVRTTNNQSTSFIGYALVDPTTNKLYVGKNATIQAGALDYITFSFTDNTYGG